MSYVDINLPDEVKKEVLSIVSTAAQTGRIRRGVNEVTKSIERKSAQLVVIAEDVSPEEIVIHIPALCKEKSIPYVFVKSKEELGKNAGIERPASSVAIEEPGAAKEALASLLKKLPEVKPDGNS